MAYLGLTKPAVSEEGFLSKIFGICTCSIKPAMDYADIAKKFAARIGLPSVQGAFSQGWDFDLSKLVSKVAEGQRYGWNPSRS